MTREKYKRGSFMKKKKVCLIIFLFFLLWATSAGQYLEVPELYEKVGILGIRDSLIVSFIMMLIPAIARIINKSRLEFNKGKKICKWNSVIFFILSIIISTILLNGNGFVGIGGVGAFIFYFINKWIFVEETDEKESKIFKFIIWLFVIIIVGTTGIVVFINLSDTKESTLRETGKSYILTEDGQLIESGTSYTLIEE